MRVKVHKFDEKKKCLPVSYYHSCSNVACMFSLFISLISCCLPVFATTSLVFSDFRYGFPVHVTIIKNNSMVNSHPDARLRHFTLVRGVMHAALCNFYNCDFQTGQQYCHPDRTDLIFVPTLSARKILKVFVIP